MLLDDGRGKNEPTRQFAFRVPKSLSDYVAKRAGTKRGALTRVIEDALGLHRALYRALEQHKPQLQQFALDEGMDWATQESEVYVRLILRALEDAKQRRK